jgi:hypothetical protein
MQQTDFCLRWAEGEEQGQEPENRIKRNRRIRELRNKSTFFYPNLLF